MSAAGGRQRDARGFTLVELLITLVITSMIGAAVYGLLAGGQGAFRREPQLIDRQQNIRVALDAIASEVSQAGAGLDPFAQAFTDGLDGDGPADYPSVINPSPAQNSDILEILASDAGCPPIQVCNNPGNSVVVNTFEKVPACYALPSLVYIYGSAGPATAAGPPGLLKAFPHAGNPQCGGDHLNFPKGLAAGYNPGPGMCNSQGTNCQYIAKSSVIAYMIAPDPGEDDPTQPGKKVPALWRSPVGRFAEDGTPLLPPSAPWQMIARGIEDLQVQYLNGAQAAGVAADPAQWPALPGDTACTTQPSCTLAEYNTIVRQVRVVLSARAIYPNLQGETATQQGNAVRGQLSTVVTPRAALLHLSAPAPSPLPLWK